MKYNDVTLAHVIYRVDPDYTEPQTLKIGTIHFIPKYIGPREELSIKDSSLILTIQVDMTRKVYRPYAFSLTEDGDIIDDESQYSFDLQQAIEEQIIISTTHERERNLGMQNLFEEGELGQEQKD